MAYNPNNLHQTATGLGSGKRIFPESMTPGTFKIGSGTIGKGTVVAFETTSSQWVPWDADGANGTSEIRGIVWPDDVTLDSDEEVLGQIMLTGRAHVVDLIPGGSETIADMKTELRANARTRGMTIEGLDGVR